MPGRHRRRLRGDWDRWEWGPEGLGQVRMGDRGDRGTGGMGDRRELDTWEWRTGGWGTGGLGHVGMGDGKRVGVRDGGMGDG